MHIPNPLRRPHKVTRRRAWTVRTVIMSPLIAMLLQILCHEVKLNVTGILERLGRCVFWVFEQVQHLTCENRYVTQSLVIFEMIDQWPTHLIFSHGDSGDLFVFVPMRGEKEAVSLV